MTVTNILDEERQLTVDSIVDIDWVCGVTGNTNICDVTSYIPEITGMRIAISRY
jgi:hypothetical protein